MRFNIEIASVLSIMGIIISHFFGDFTLPLEILFIAMAIDYATGVLKAIYNKNLSSKEGFKGLLKKFAVLSVIILGYQLGRLTNQIIIRDFVCFFYIANEGLSVLENVSEMNGDFPEFIKNKLLNFKDENNKRVDEDK